MAKRHIIIILGILLVGGLGIVMARLASPLMPEELNRKFITSNPLDLSQIAGFSKYRSCVGHDFRGPSAATGEKEATPRSMKHYVKVRGDLRGKNGIVKALAPFDGKIFNIDDDLSGGPGDQQIWLTPDSISPRQWQFIFFHIALADGLKKGSAVKAGQLIGTANLRRGPDMATDNFDIAVKFTRPFQAPAVDAPFNHVAQSVLDEYERHGISANDLIIPEKERDAAVCPIDPNVNYGGPDVYFSREASPGDSVWLRN
ncbi:MAG: hypothetical protein HYY86_02995 [Candidatus Harrisonbacteria bacterium]|nr:hypothetical protein [Candidatus Harrisonbacteria bacterium]